ncbi:helix-turn-helix domain-containing protein [Occallatibacter riparius]|uniref:Helix-turn-helix domain-containing protein n=1 Tax=Occallatibacter riparius TaxID=1002689 RepID=A0A9J7BUN9_9BACT|nr:helix-turn-helix transcriptional regulator [Occallatibacter riparius]UWZ84638.1 helix-turn-helix domain-containing protein [Occallatibacter riparius]
MAKARTEEEKLFDVEVGKRITAAREAAKVSQAELASAIGVSQQLVAKYESGGRISPILLRKTAVALRVSLLFLVPNTTPSCILADSSQRLMNFH